MKDKFCGFYGLQWFAEGDDGGADDGNANGTEGEAAESNDNGATFDDFLAVKENQSEFDRRVQQAITKAVSNAKTKWEALADDKLTEAEKLAKMSSEEKAAYKMQQLEKELAALKRKSALADMGSTARQILSEKGITLPDGLLNRLVCEEAEETKTMVEAFAQLYTTAVQDGVKNALKGKTPPAGMGGKVTLTKEAIIGVKNPAERQRLIAENMELFQ